MAFISHISSAFFSRICVEPVIQPRVTNFMSQPGIEYGIYRMQHECLNHWIISPYSPYNEKKANTQKHISLWINASILLPGTPLPWRVIKESGFVGDGEVTNNNS